MLTLGLAVNQVATGLALTILGLGLSGLIGAGFVGERIAPAPHLYIPVPDRHSRSSAASCSAQDAFVYVSIALVVGIWWFLYRTRAGLMLRAVGDNHASAHALGYPVLRIRMLAVLFGGACAGLAGAYLSLAYTPFFIPGMTAGRGWIALALVVFASWRPGRLVVGAYLFGAVTILQLHAQGCGPRHSVAADVGAALSGDHHRSGPDFARARTGGLDRAGVAWAGRSCPIAEHIRSARDGRALREYSPPVRTGVRP